MTGIFRELFEVPGYCEQPEACLEGTDQIGCFASMPQTAPALEEWRSGLGDDLMVPKKASHSESEVQDGMQQMHAFV